MLPWPCACGAARGRWPRLCSNPGCVPVAAGCHAGAPLSWLRVARRACVHLLPRWHRRKCFAVSCIKKDFRDGYGEWLQRWNACRDENKRVVVKITDRSVYGRGPHVGVGCVWVVAHAGCTQRRRQPAALVSSWPRWRTSIMCARSSCPRPDTLPCLRHPFSTNTLAHAAARVCTPTPIPTSAGAAAT